MSVHGVRLPYESGLERDLLHLFSLDDSIHEVMGQPTTISFEDPKTGKARRYTPDFLVRRTGDGPEWTLYEVKYRSQLWKDFFTDLKPKFLAARRLCRERGWEFRIMTEVEIRDGPRADNLAFLRRYKDVPCDPSIEECLAATLATIGPCTPQALLAATYQWDGNKARAIPHLWRMVREGRIHFDLSKPLTMASTISIIVGEGYLWTDPYAYRSPRDPAFDPPDASTSSPGT